jgi:hypothetical protein
MGLALDQFDAHWKAGVKVYHPEGYRPVEQVHDVTQKYPAAGSKLFSANSSYLSYHGSFMLLRHRRLEPNCDLFLCDKGIEAKLWIVVVGMRTCHASALFFQHHVTVPCSVSCFLSSSFLRFPSASLCSTHCTMLAPRVMSIVGL